MTMDKRSDDGGRLSPLEQVKLAHDFKRAEILLNDDDDIEWPDDIMPEQVGLRQVWADANGHLWIITRESDKTKLKRIWQIT
jgi:hypothetical protein